MINSEIIKKRQIIVDENDTCESVKELITSKKFYMYLERFSNLISKKDLEFEHFFNKYFNLEGFKDIWRIPGMLLDIYNGNMGYHKKLLEDEYFRKMLAQLVSRFYNYCMEKENILRLNEEDVKDGEVYYKNLYSLKKKQLLFNIVTDAYCNIMDKLSIYQ